MTKPNILYLSIDALRADRCFDRSKSSKTPNIDSLIKNGICFTSAFSSSDGTPVSFSSIFTGCYPFKSSFRKGRWHFKLNKNLKDFVTLLKQNGYHAYCTMPNMWVVEEFTSLFENEDKTYPLFGFRLPDGLGNKIIELIESKMNEPWFYFVHLLDAHKPISFPEEFDLEEFGKDDYDRMISALDLWVGKILETINLKNTLIIFSADHGDYLRVIENDGKRISFEFKSYAKQVLSISKYTPKFLYPIKNKLFLLLRDVLTHIRITRLGRKLTPYEKRSLFNTRSNPDRYIFDELFRVPLIFCGYGIPPSNNNDQLVRTIDIFPTIFEILGINMQNEVDGRSIYPIINGKQISEMPAYMESGFNLEDPSKAVMGIRTSSYKYFRSLFVANQSVHLYDLKNDPYEEKNIASQFPKIVNNLESQLLEVRKEKDGGEKNFLKRKIADKRKKLLLGR